MEQQHQVARPFKTDNRRFVVGAPVAPADITGPVAFDTWLERGFIRAVPPAAEPAPEADAPRKGRAKAD